MSEGFNPDWEDADRIPVMNPGDDSVGQALLAAFNAGYEVQIVYHGGSSPGTARSIRPNGFFRVRGYEPIYVEAFCRTRSEQRVFRVDKITLLAETAEAAALGVSNHSCEIETSDTPFPVYVAQPRTIPLYFGLPVALFVAAAFFRDKPGVQGPMIITALLSGALCLIWSVCRS